MARDDVGLGGDAAQAVGHARKRAVAARGRTLLVVQNAQNRIAVVRLSRDLRSGRVVKTITDPDFDVPTTITFARGALWAVNARFGTPPSPETEYDIVRVG